MSEDEKTGPTTTRVKTGGTVPRERTTRFWLALFWSIMTLVPPFILILFGIMEPKDVSTWFAPLLPLCLYFMRDYFKSGESDESTR